MSPVKIEVIINASSGDGNKEHLQQRLAEAFTATGLEARISMAHSGSEVIALAQRAARSEVETIVAGGGDGTINSVASSIFGSDKALGILPFGTMNHFAKDLHIPLDLERAVQTIAAGQTAQVD